MPRYEWSAKWAVFGQGAGRRPGPGRSARVEPEQVGIAPAVLGARRLGGRVHREQDRLRPGRHQRAGLAMAEPVGRTDELPSPVIAPEQPPASIRQRGHALARLHHAGEDDIPLPHQQRRPVAPERPRAVVRRPAGGDDLLDLDHRLRGQERGGQEKDDIR